MVTNSSEETLDMKKKKRMKKKKGKMRKNRTEHPRTVGQYEKI